MMERRDLAILRCPACRGALGFKGPRRSPAPASGWLTCQGCAARFPVEDGWPRLYREEEVKGSDRLLRVLYDRLAPLHDPAVRYTLPLMGAGREDDLRAAYLERLQLGELWRPGKSGTSLRTPLRILDIGIGTGADLPALRAMLPGKRPVEIWGVDLSLGMLERCRARLQDTDPGGVRLVVADAHALPFADGVFDRVFHVGAMNSFRQPGRVLAEMGRVARPGTPLVVVDERLDPGRDHSLLQRLFFRAVTFYERNPHCPSELLPAGATAVLEEQLNRYFYCLSWMLPPAAPAVRRRPGLTGAQALQHRARR